MVEETNSESAPANGVSASTASNQNEISSDPPSSRGSDVTTANGLSGSNSAASATGILNCFIVFIFDRKTHQLAKQESVELFLFNIDLVLEELMGKNFKLCLILKGSAEISSLNILIKRQVDLMLL